MNTDSHKRLEEAAENYADDVATTEERGWMDIYAIAKDAYLAGTEYGYKEAVKMAKEWFDEKMYDGSYWGRDDEGSFLDGDELLTDFETDLNKLWEDEK